MLSSLALLVASQSPLTVALTPGAPTPEAALRWSPKGASIELARDGAALQGRFALGPAELAPIAVRLERSADAAHFDVLLVDLDRDGRFGEGERQLALPKEQRGKWWSSFSATVPIALPAPEGAAAGTAPRSRPYPLDLWFVEDPLEPDAPPALRWSRRGWHEGELAIDGRPAFVLVTELHMDGVFDQRDAWMLARERAALFVPGARDLDGHAWLDGKAYRPVRIDPHGLALSFEPFDPGFTEAEERAKADVHAADRNAPRAEKPLAFERDLAAALARAAKEGKRVLVDFETTWCGPCATMNQLVYTSKAVVDAAKDVIAVKLDGDEQRELVRRHAVSGYPTILLLGPDGTELRRAVGYRSVAEMVELLKP